MKEIVIRRDSYLNELVRKRNNGSIKVVTGLRRSGKSYLLNNLFYDFLLKDGVPRERIIKLALDDDRNREYRDPDRLSDYLHSRITDGSDTFYLLLDEVQFAISDEEIKSKEPLRLYGILNGLLGLRNVDVYVTGSNSRFLSSDVSTEFRGRGDVVDVNPLSFSEFFSVYENGDRYDAWDEYSTYGGMPMLPKLETGEDKADYLNALFRNVYVRDIVERNNLRGDVVLDTLIDVLASSIGSLSNPSKIAKTFVSKGVKTVDKTVSAYVECLMDAFLIRKASRYDIRGRIHIDSPFKYYFTDVGLRNARLNFRRQEQTHIMENVIYNELVKRGYDVDVGFVDHVVRDESGRRGTRRLEVDFVCDMANQRYYVQSAFSVPTVEEMEREQAPFDRIGDSFKKIIVTQDRTKPWRNEKGYVVMNLLDFLLKEDSLEF